MFRTVYSVLLAAVLGIGLIEGLETKSTIALVCIGFGLGGLGFILGSIWNKVD